MKLTRKLSVEWLMLIMLMVIPKIPCADVLMTGSITGFGMDILPTASFTTDDWLNRQGMFTITIVNGDTKTVKFAEILMEISHGGYGTVLTGTLTVVNENQPNRAFKSELKPGEAYTVNNTMLKEGTPQLTGGEWEDSFKDEVVRTGSLPEGRYTMRFTLQGYYGSSSDPIESGHEIQHVIEIRNPTPPELITPEDMSDNVVTVPRFAWQRPLVSDLSDINQRTVNVFYNISVWRMFGEDGSVISEEDAIHRIPIWEVKGLTMESIAFDPGTAWEELVAGRKYCWQVQAVDGVGRPISPINNGKSDVWQFTCKFTPPILNQPFSFYPFRCSWTGAQAGSGMVYYRIRIADNSDFVGAFVRRDIVMNQFIYPADAPPLRLGTTYYLELQATDDSGVPIGEPVTATFTLPTARVVLRAPADGSVPSTDTPKFEWDGDARFYVVMIYDEVSDWNFISGAIEGRSWVYDGEALKPGRTYAWNVAPANEMGDTVGKSSDTWYFSIPSENQVVLLSPVSEQLDTIFPTFTWREVRPPTGQGTVEYIIVVEDADGSTVHSATVSAVSYEYPKNATILRYGAKYTWFVTAQQENVAIGEASQRASFTTPLAGASGTISTMEELGDMIKIVLSEYPEFEPYMDKILVSVSDENGPMTPSAFLELFERFRIARVSGK